MAPSCTSRRTPSCRNRSTSSTSRPRRHRTSRTRAPSSSAGDNSQMKVVESYAGHDGERYLTNAVTEIVCGENSHVEHYRVQRESHDAYHVSSTHVFLERSAVFAQQNFTFGGGIVRNDVNAVWAARASNCTLNGLYLAQRVAARRQPHGHRSRQAALREPRALQGHARRARPRRVQRQDLRPAGRRRRPTRSRPTRSCCSPTTRRSTPSRSWRSSPTT